MHNESSELPTDFQQEKLSVSSSDLARSNRVTSGGIIADVIYAPEGSVVSGTQNNYYYQNQAQEERLARETHQRARIKEQRNHLSERLKNFVGRTRELADLQAKIAQQQVQGGYVIVTGEAGQGKSSLITKLIVELGEEKIGAFHLIPVNAGYDHQASLMRDLVKQLVYKHDLPTWYMSESYATLRENLREMLDEIAKQGKQEILCLDGLDLLEITAGSEPDLSFLPHDLPPGIAFVIGTRPNEVLSQVQRLVKSQVRCEVGQLGHEYFTLLLHQRQITVSAEMSQRLYQAMQGNALYLSVLIQVLDTQRDQPAEKIIAQVENNPDGIFTLAFARLKQRRDEWRNVIRPILGTLLVAREPLTSQQLAHISAGENYLFHDGIEHLGGFLTNTGQARYTLFHLKLYEYLRQDQSHPERGYEFDAEEEAHFHGKLAVWCGQGKMDYLWSDMTMRSLRDDYREYARRHYITHLYYAGMDEQLFTVLDNGTYERGKLRRDVSARSVVQDLILACQAAARETLTLDEGITQLTRLWRYTLLRSSLTSRADANPLETFEALLALGMSREAIDLAELLTQPERKLDALVLLARHLAQQPERVAESQQLFRQAHDLVAELKDQQSQTEALVKLTLAHIKVGQLEQAEIIVHAIADDRERFAMLSELSAAYGQKRDVMKAETIARSIEMKDEALKALSALAAVREKAGDIQQAEILWHEVKAAASALPDHQQQVRAWSSIAMAFLSVQRWEQVDAIVQIIGHDINKVEFLSEMALELTLKGEQEQAKTKWQQVQMLVRSTPAGVEHTRMQRILVMALSRANRLAEAHEVIQQMEDGKEQALARKSMVMGLIAGSRWQESQDALAEMRKRYRRDDIIGEMFDEMLIAFAIAFVRAEQWEQAQTMVTWISHSQSQHRARMRLVSELATIGQHEKAQKAWDDAQHITSTFQVRSGMSRAMRVFISAFIHAGWIEQAQTIIEKSSDEEIREDLTCELAIALARIGQIAEAKAQSETILSSRKQMATQRAIVQALLDASKIKQAQEVALTIEREEDRWQALKQVVEAYASGQQLEEATRTAYLILDLNTQAEALGSVAIVLARQDQLQQARSIIKSLTAPYPKDQIWCEIATLIESKGVARVAENLRRQISNEHIQKKAICHKFIAVQQRQWAEKEAQEIQDQIVRDEALHNVGLAYIQACEWKHAKRVSILIHGREQQSKILRVLASKSAYDGKWECALAAYESLPRHQRLAVAQDWGKLLERTGERAQAEKILDYLKDSQERASFQAGIVYVMGERARYQDMMRFIQQAWLQAETQDTCLYLFALAKQLMERYPDMGRTLYGAFDWVDSFLQDKGHTLLTASSASDEESKA